MVPEPRVVEHAEEDGRRYLIEWFDPPFGPSVHESTQAYGLCFTAQGKIVLVECEPRLWQLPGGGIERGETFLETLFREVREEACARVIDAEYIGCQRVTESGDLDPALDRKFDARGSAMKAPYYQTRFWARVELDEWDPKHETTARKLVAPEAFLATLWWGSAATARIVLENGLAIERARS